MTLFDMHGAHWILAAAGVFLAASASARLLRVARDVMRRRGLARSLLFVALSAPVAFWAGGKGGGGRSGNGEPQGNDEAAGGTVGLREGGLPSATNLWFTGIERLADSVALGVAWDPGAFASPPFLEFFARTNLLAGSWSSVGWAESRPGETNMAVEVEASRLPGGAMPASLFVMAEAGEGIVLDYGDDDGDGITNADERLSGTNPRCADTDGDGLLDGEEIGGVSVGRGVGECDGVSMSTNLTAELLADPDHCVNVAVHPISVLGEVYRRVSVDANGLLYLCNDSAAAPSLPCQGNILTLSPPAGACAVAPYWDRLSLSTNAPASSVTVGSRGLLTVVEYANMRVADASDPESCRVSVKVVLPGLAARPYFSFIYEPMTAEASGRAAGFGVRSADGLFRVSSTIAGLNLGAVSNTVYVNLGRGTDPLLPDTDGDGLSDGEETGCGGQSGVGTDPLAPDTDGDCLPDGWEFSNGLDPLSGQGDDGESGDPDGDGLSNFSEYAVGADPQNPHTFSPETGDVEYVGYGMCAYPPVNGVQVSVSVGDPSGSHSERWKMVLEEPGGFGRTYQIVCGAYGVVSTQSVVLEPGRHYVGRIEHLATNGMLADYDWTAQIDGLPSTAVMSPGRERWICIADKLVMIDNDSGLLGTCDASFGTENRTEGRRFDVYTVSVRPTHLKFNWDGGSSATDAVNLRRDYDTAYDVSEGEYTPLHSYPFCYVTNTVPVVKAKFQVAPESVTNLELDAVFEGELLSDLGPAVVGFDAGESGYVDFAMPGGVASAVGVCATNSYSWRVRAINGTPLGSPKAVATTGLNKTYVILGEPVEPWSNAPNARNNAWSTALDLTCQWAEQCDTWQIAASNITRSIFESGRFVYETRHGAPRYTGSQGWIIVDSTVYLGAAINRLNGGIGRGGKVNCADCASLVCAFANLLGCELYSSKMEPSGFWKAGFDTNPYCAIGCSDWTPPSWGWGFSFHEVAWSGNCGDSDMVFDACLSVDGDGSPGVLPYLKTLPANVMFCDGNPATPNSYKEMLTPNSPNGYYICVPSQSDRIRRLLR